MQKTTCKNQDDRLKAKNIFLFLICHFAFLFLIFDFSYAYAWRLPVEVATYTDDGEKMYNKLVVGIEAGATDGFDNLWDAPALVSHPDPDNPALLRAHLNGKGSNGEDTKPLWKDIRGTTTTEDDTIWEITVDSIPAGKPVVISWEAPQGGVLRAGERIVLRDNGRLDTGGKPVQTEIARASSYVFLTEGDGARSLSLVLSKERHDSGSGSRFGCGTIKLHKDGPADTGMAAWSIIALFSPIIFLRLLRFARNGWKGV